MTDVKIQWENYMRMGEQIKEEFERQIEAFSYFLSEINPDYYYNATYLQNYVIEFLQFLEQFHIKYPLVRQIFDMASSYAGVTLIVDRYWQQESVWNKERKEILITHKVHHSHERIQVCDEKLWVECSVLCDTKRFIYQDKTGIDETQQLLQNLERFLKDKLSSENGKEEK